MIIQNEPLSRNILRYGFMVSDISVELITHDFMRVYVFRYQGYFYQILMLNGEIIQTNKLGKVE